LSFHVHYIVLTMHTTGRNFQMHSNLMIHCLFQISQEQNLLKFLKIVTINFVLKNLLECMSSYFMHKLWSISLFYVGWEYLVFKYRSTYDSCSANLVEIIISLEKKKGSTITSIWIFQNFNNSF
jgi:hypothetical protein